MEEQYTFRVNAACTSLRNGVASVEGIESPIAFSAPAEFQGESGRWTAEHLCLAAVAACFINTFSGMAHISKFDYLSLDMETEGILEKEEGGWRFTQIHVRPRLKIALQKDCDRANRLLEKAEKSCLVVRSLNSRVVLEPEVLIEELQLEREQMSIDP